jgi:hypothetical protein
MSSEPIGMPAGDVSVSLEELENGNKRTAREASGFTERERSERSAFFNRIFCSSGRPPADPRVKNFVP